MARGGLVAVSVGFAASVLVFGVSAAADPGSGHAATHRTQGNAGTSGSPTSPQPLSTADQTGGGANRSGPYDSTRNGSPSGNGNGKGQAVGKPCAGCVGKADNKNPPGQLAVGSAGSGISNGYECNGNHGIGRTNPAHTGCRVTTPTTIPSTTPTSVPVVTPPSAVHHGQAVIPAQLVRALEAAPQALSAAAKAVSAAAAALSPASLPVTGINAVTMLLVGLGAVVLGGLLVRSTRRRTLTG
jgi:LPXTG-motif cell wall-anchored protein